MKSIKFLLNGLILFLAVATFTACGDDDDPTPTPETITEIAAANANLTTLVSALTRTGLDATLDGTGTFTVFAPTNAAFEALGVDLSTISDADLTNILLNHVLAAEVKAGDIADGQTYVSTLSASGPGGEALSILIEKGTAVKINNTATVSTADVDATNGVIHIVDAVIMPLDVVGHAAANSSFTSLVGALGAASGDLVTVLSGAGPFTVFAPVNSAFDAISTVTATLSADELAGVLTYHVASGNVRSTALTDGMEVTTVNTGTFTVNLGTTVTITDANGGTSTVVLTDVQGTNGVIHVLDTVLLP